MLDVWPVPPLKSSDGVERNILGWNYEALGAYLGQYGTHRIHNGIYMVMLYPKSEVPIQTPLLQ